MRYGPFLPTCQNFSFLYLQQELKQNYVLMTEVFWSTEGDLFRWKNGQVLFSRDIEQKAYHIFFFFFFFFFS